MIEVPYPASEIRVLIIPHESDYHKLIREEDILFIVQCVDKTFILHISKNYKKLIDECTD
jgi:hypothetical protein